MDRSTANSRARGTFARPGVRQGWYLVGSTRQLPPGRLRTVDIGPRRPVLYRDLDRAGDTALDRYAGLVDRLPAW